MALTSSFLKRLSSQVTIQTFKPCSVLCPVLTRCYKTNNVSDNILNRSAKTSGTAMNLTHVMSLPRSNILESSPKLSVPSKPITKTISNSNIKTGYNIKRNIKNINIINNMSNNNNIGNRSFSSDLQSGQSGQSGENVETEQINMLTALNDALRITLLEDSKSCIFGEDVAFGGVFRVTQNLREEFGSDRVFNSPLSEQGIVGFGAGLAAVGYTAIAEIQFADYIMPAWDQIVNEVAKFRYRSASDWDCGKLTIRTASAAVGHGALYHSQSPESYFAHCPGIKLVYPRGAYTAKGLLRAAIKEPDPVIFFEPKRMYAFPREDVPIEDYTIPLGKADIIRSGNDVTIIGWGALLTMTMIDACNYIEEKEGISIELIDLQTIMPFDEETIINSVKKTGKLVICHEATLTAGFGAELAATVQEKCFLHLEAPIQRVTGHDTPNGLIYEPLFIPDKFRIYEAVKKVIQY